MSVPVTRSSRSPKVTRVIPFVVLGLGAWLSGACAGRAESLSDGMDGSSGAGGSSGASAGDSGAAHAGSPALIAGAPGASAAGAGASAVAAGAGGESNVCDSVDCPGIVCAEGSELAVPAGACCATCQCTQACLTCPIDTRAEMQTGQCCPVCVPSNPPPISCDAGKMLYAASRAQFLEKYSEGCSADSQCVTMTVANSCESCQPVALTSAAAMFFSGNTSSAAAADCGGCPPVAPPPCVAPPAPVCVNNFCKLPG